MARKVYVWRDGALVELTNDQQSNAPTCHAVIQDTMQATEHPANGKVYESKSAFRRVTKIFGYQEVGSDWKNPDHRPKPKSFIGSSEHRESIRREIHESLKRHNKA